MPRTRDRLTSVLRIRTLQQDLAASARRQAEQVVAEQQARFVARQADLRTPWTDRALVELAFSAADRAAAGLAAAAAVADERRSDHLAAVQRARAIERLVERRRAEEARDEARKAVAVLDDLVATRHRRRKP